MEIRTIQILGNRMSNFRCSKFQVLMGQNDLRTGIHISDIGTLIQYLMNNSISDI